MSTAPLPSMDSVMQQRLKALGESPSRPREEDELLVEDEPPRPRGGTEQGDLGSVEASHRSTEVSASATAATPTRLEEREEEADSTAPSPPVAPPESSPSASSPATASTPPTTPRRSGAGAGGRPSMRHQTSFAAKPSAADRVGAAAQHAAAMKSAMARAMDNLNAKVAEAPVVKVVAEALGMKPMVVAISAALGFLGFLLFGLGGQLVCTVVGVMYPAFESFKVIENGDASEMEFWLTYWVVYASITAMEHATFYICAWLPFYYPMKLGFLLWLCSMNSGGSKYVYRWFVSPVLIKHRDMIDEALDSSSTKLKTGVRSAVNSAVSASVDTAKGAGAEGMRQLRRGLSFVKPGMGSIASLCLETAVAAASRSRAMSGDAAAAVFGAAPKSVASPEPEDKGIKGGSNIVDADDCAPAPSQEPSEEPAAEPPASAELPERLEPRQDQEAEPRIERLAPAPEAGAVKTFSSPQFEGASVPRVTFTYEE